MRDRTDRGRPSKIRLPMTFLPRSSARNPILGGVVLSLLASTGTAQVVVYERSAEAAGDSFGAALSLLADIDGDGVAELLVGAPRSDFGAGNGGSCYVLSGAGGTQLMRIDGSSQGERLGQAVAGLGDLDGDGTPDLLVGAPFHAGAAFLAGAAFVRSGSTGGVLQTVLGQDSFGLLGMAVANAGDVNGDGTDDYLVGSPAEDSNGTDSGGLYLFSGATGIELAHPTGDAGGDQLGTSLCGLGDLDGDGLADFASGAPFDDNNGADSGAVRAWSGATGAVLFTADGASAGDHFGSAIAGLGDVDGDGKGDLAVGAPSDGSAGPDAGSVRVLSGATGLELFAILGSPGQTLGSSVAAAGDVDGDGVPDLILGGRDGDVALVCSGVDGGLLFDVAPPAGSSAWGSAVLGGLDIDGDGRSEFCVSDELSPAGGRIVTYADHSLLGASYCSGDGTARACPCGNTGGTDEGCANSTGAGATLAAAGTASASADDLLLLADQLVPAQPALLFAGLQRVQAGNGVLFGDGLRCAGAGVKRLGVRQPDAQGAATWGPGLGALGGWSAGDIRRLQVWYRDPLASPCGAGFNLSNGLELSFVQ